MQKTALEDRERLSNLLQRNRGLVLTPLSVAFPFVAFGAIFATRRAALTPPQLLDRRSVLQVREDNCRPRRVCKLAELGHHRVVLR